MTFTVEREEGYEKPVLNTGPGLTKQSMKDQTDINRILLKYQKTGVQSFVSQVQPEFVETAAMDFQEAMNLVLDAQNKFQEMPSSLRKKFDNDPGQYLAFVQDPANLDEMYELGMAERPPEPAPPTAAPEPVPVAEPAP